MATNAKAMPTQDVAVITSWKANLPTITLTMAAPAAIIAPIVLIEFLDSNDSNQKVLQTTYMKSAHNASLRLGLLANSLEVYSPKAYGAQYKNTQPSRMRDDLVIITLE